MTKPVVDAAIVQVVVCHEFTVNRDIFVLMVRDDLSDTHALSTPFARMTCARKSMLHVEMTRFTLKCSGTPEVLNTRIIVVVE